MNNTAQLSGQTSEATNQQDPQRGELPWLIGIMRRLLGPDGCPWDREQTLETLRPYLIEECYEVLDALDSGDKSKHCEELGDLLLQIVFQAELADIDTSHVVQAIGEKLIRRHPHVFSDVTVRNSDEVVENWEAIKSREKSARDRKSVFDGIPRALPALQRSYALTKKATKIDYIRTSATEGTSPQKEIAAQLSRVATAPNAGDAEREIGETLLAIADWCRSLNIDPEQALRTASNRFEEAARQFEKSKQHALK